MRLVPDDVWAILTIAMEAGGEPYSGKVAIGKIIRNRMRLKIESDGTVIGTVLKPFQFSCWNATAILRLWAAKADLDDPVIHECAEAWQASGDPAVDPGVGDAAVFYFNPRFVEHVPGFADPKKWVADIGHHVFYRAA